MITIIFYLFISLIFFAGCDGGAGGMAINLRYSDMPTTFLALSRRFVKCQKYILAVN